MSAKDMRVERLQRMKTITILVKQSIDAPDVTLRTLQRRTGELALAWKDYDDSHNKAIVREKDVEVINVYQEEHGLLVGEHDSLLNRLEDDIEAALGAEYGHVPKPLTAIEELLILQQEYSSTLKISQERFSKLDTGMAALAAPSKVQIEAAVSNLNSMKEETMTNLERIYKSLLKLTPGKDLPKIADTHSGGVASLLNLVDAVSITLVSKIPDYVPDSLSVSSLSETLALTPRENAGNTYKAYAKESIPTFKGQLRQYPSWRKEMKELVLPHLQPVHQIRILDKHSPASVDLQNCDTIKDAWQELDSKFGNSANITTVLMDDFFKVELKSRSDESRLVELKTSVTRLSSDLVAVEQAQVLHENPYAINHIVKLMPRFWQNKYSEKKASLQAGGKSQWEGMVGFLRDESLRLETELPWSLDSFAKKTDDKRENYPSQDFDPSKREKKRINALKKEGDQEAKKSLRFEEMRAKYGLCPNCKDHHNFVGRNGQLMASDSLRNCESFTALTSQQRAMVVEKNRVCANCLSWNHERADCQREKRVCGKNKCLLLHNTLLHGTNVNYVNLARNGGKRVDDEEEEEASVKFLHLISHCFSGRNLTLVLLLDDGSDTSLITLTAAGFLGLKGKKKMTFLMTAGSTEAVGKMMTHYAFDLTDNDGKTVSISCIGVDAITQNSNSRVNLEEAYLAFPHVPKGALDRPKDEVAILIGQDHAALLASGGRGKDVVGNLRAMRTKLGSGWVLGGWCPQIQGPNTPAVPGGAATTSVANTLRQSRIVAGPKRVNLLRLDKWDELQDLSCQLPRRCTRCKSCHACRHEAQDVTASEQRELELLKNSITYDAGEKCCIVSYPIIGDLNLLTNNEWQAKAMAAGLERSLKKKDKLVNYNKEFKEYVERGVLVEVDRLEIEEWEAKGGAVNYISHHGVETPHKATTKTRLVSNPSIKNGGKGPSVNDFWPKGPLSLNPMIEVFIRFRGYKVACHFDIKKMYHSVKTTDQEKFLRLMVWRMDDNSWKIFGYQVVAMGDRPAACTLELVKDIAAEMGEEVDLVTALRIKEDTFVDDGCTGGTEEEVRRMIGTVTESEEGSLQYSGLVQVILEKISFRIKMMVRSGEENKTALEKMGGAVLGHSWDPLEDLFTFQPKVFMGKKVASGLHQGPELIISNLHLLTDFTWTRRTVLSTIAGIYDPAGLIAPYVMKYKLFLREVCLSGKMDWDDPLPVDLHLKWLVLIEELVRAPVISVPRSAVPKEGFGPMELIVYSDGSLTAYCACLYLRQQTRLKDLGPWLNKYDEKTTWSASLLLSKARVAPLSGITPPRSEVNGFILGLRLSTLAMRSLREKPASIQFILDSECTISAMESDHGRLTSYLANRRGEYLDTKEIWEQEFPRLRILPLLHTAGPLNISDIGTRDTVSAHMVDQGSEWQKGPEYLTQPFVSWPVSRDFKKDIPEAELKGVKANIVNCCSIIIGTKPVPPNIATNLWTKLSNILFLSNDLAKCRGIMARTLRYSREAANHEPAWQTEDQRWTSLRVPLSVLDLRLADKIIFKLMQPQVEELLGSKQTGRKRRRKQPTNANEVVGSRNYQSTFNMASLAPFKEKGIFWTQGRFGNELGKVLGPIKLAILPPTCRLAQLLMIDSHNEAHRAGGDTCFRSRARAWIVRARPLADRTSEACLKCRRDSRRYESQQMGMLPKQRCEIPSKPWTSVAIDLLGPFQVKAMNNARSKLKVWPIVFGCHHTGALHTELSWTYGADAFLSSFDAFKAIRGTPAHVYTDRGTQLMKAASLVTREDPKSWDWSEVEERASRDGTEWKSCPPGSQWRNGLAEQRVRALKDTMELLVPGGVENLNYAEFSSLLKSCSNTINDRPIGVRHQTSGTEGELVPLTPNLLLLGRAPTSPPTNSTPYNDDNSSFSKRADFVKELEQLWWNMWFRQVFDSLFPLAKWKTRMPNLKIGDICLMGAESKLGKGRYRLCRVTSVEEDERGLVRSVQVCYRPTSSKEPGLPYNPKLLTTSKSAIQNLILICPSEDIPE